MKRIVDAEGKTTHVVLLDKGEPVPVACDCGAMYQPALDSEKSVCPECGKANVHEEQDWALVDNEDEDEE